MENNNYEAFRMHVSFFDHVREAINKGFFYEAIFLEYAAIESRLEVLCGLVGYPCSRDLDVKSRRKVNISQRVECLEKYYRKNAFETQRSKTKMPRKEWKNLNKWIGEKRNPYVHGLFKNPEVYLLRSEKSAEVAAEGYRLADLLYKEVKRVKGIIFRQSTILSYNSRQCNHSCY